VEAKGPWQNEADSKRTGADWPLGIPTVRDRVVQAAVLLILEPIFEVDFLDCSFGFRPGRNAHQALETIRQNLAAGRSTVYDADLEGYFDSIPHDQLLACVRMRVVDGSVLRLIKQWLNAPVEETDDEGRKRRRRNPKGTPQGGVISPLLANIYLHWFDRVFHAKDGPARRVGAVLVRYADDFVVLARRAGETLLPGLQLPAGPGPPRQEVTLLEYAALWQSSGARARKAAGAHQPSALLPTAAARTHR